LEEEEEKNEEKCFLFLIFSMLNLNCLNKKNDLLFNYLCDLFYSLKVCFYFNVPFPNDQFYSLSFLGVLIGMF